eukprot:EG_transcript_5826
MLPEVAGVAFGQALEHYPIVEKGCLSDDETDAFSSESHGSMLDGDDADAGRSAADGEGEAGRFGRLASLDEASEVDSDWSGEASDVSDLDALEAEAEEDTASDHRLGRFLWTTQSAHLSSLRVAWYPAADFHQHLTADDLECDAVAEMLLSPPAAAGAAGRAAVLRRLPRAGHCLALRLFGRLVGLAEVHPGPAGDSSRLTVVRRLAIHPDFRDTSGLFAGTLLLTRLLSALHQTVLASRWPVLGFCMPCGAGDANYEVPSALALYVGVLQQQGYRRWAAGQGLRPGPAPTLPVPGWDLYFHTTDLKSIDAKDVFACSHLLHCPCSSDPLASPASHGGPLDPAERPVPSPSSLCRSVCVSTTLKTIP